MLRITLIETETCNSKNSVSFKTEVWLGETRIGILKGEQHLEQSSLRTTQYVTFIEIYNSPFAGVYVGTEGVSRISSSSMLTALNAALFKWMMAHRDTLSPNVFMNLFDMLWPSLQIIHPPH